MFAGKCGGSRSIIGSVGTDVIVASGSKCSEEPHDEGRCPHECGSRECNVLNWVAAGATCRLAGPAETIRAGQGAKPRPARRNEDFCLGYPRNADGTCFAWHPPPNVPTHCVIVAVSVPDPMEGERIRLQGPAPVFCVATVITPTATVTPETYCVAVVEQPEL